MKTSSRKRKEIEHVLEVSEREDEARILVKEFIQGLVLGFLAGFLAAWFVLVR